MNYITWQQYEDNQQRMRDNDAHKDRTGPVRGGSALLGGRLWCAHCGRRMTVSYPKRGNAIYYCSRHSTIALGKSCLNSIRCKGLDDFIVGKLLEALSPAGTQLSLQVIEDEHVRREQLDTLHAQRVEQARYAIDLSERRYKQVDPANRLVADQLEKEWEASLRQYHAAAEKLHQLRTEKPTKLSDREKEELRKSCTNIVSLWSETMTIVERKEVLRLLVQRVEVDVLDNSERVSVQVHWSGEFQSCHEITRSVMKFEQLESYEQLINRIKELAMAGKKSREIASMLEQEGFHSPRRDTPISRMMVQSLMTTNASLRSQLNNPTLEEHHWEVGALAIRLGTAKKRLKDWVTRGWATAVQRPFGRTWVIYADATELIRLQQLAQRQTGQGRPGPPEELTRPKMITR